MAAQQNKWQNEACNNDDPVSLQLQSPEKFLKTP